MKKLFIPLAFVLIAASCNDDDDNETANPPEAAALAYSVSSNDFATTYANVVTTLEGNDAISIVVEVDHSSNASTAGLELPNTRLILFGNPTLGTPLMQENQLTGLDLPQKIMVYEEDGTVYATYNSIDYLGSRHGISAVSTAVQISGALSNITTGATGAQVSINPPTGVALRSGIVTVRSDNDFETTFTNLRSAIQGNENLSLIAELDHQANAASVDLELRPTSLLVFGNPNMGTPLMQEKRTIAIDLPQKFLVWEDEEGVTSISYNDPEFLAQRHGITGNQEVRTQIATALANLSAGAAAASGEED